ncbi:hypothetical protein CXU22_00730 [Akkermansia muciniphila]|uniref:Uncharacterized protein n=2 Tax=Akkermansia muciniphila TaxID=239935 RepID=A0A2N8HGZ5_9BACT|nr:hypothetical protein CXU22_00730 [Akkermansia muciniphila]
MFFTMCDAVEGRAWKIDVDASNAEELVLDAKTTVPRSIKSLLQDNPSLELFSRYPVCGVLLEADSPTSWSWSLVGFTCRSGQLQWDFCIDHAIVVSSVFSGFDYGSYPEKRMVWIPVNITEY